MSAESPALLPHVNPSRSLCSLVRARHRKVSSAAIGSLQHWFLQFHLSSCFKVNCHVLKLSVNYTLVIVKTLFGKCRTIVIFMKVVCYYLQGKNKNFVDNLSWGHFCKSSQRLFKPKNDFGHSYNYAKHLKTNQYRSYSRPKIYLTFEGVPHQASSCTEFQCKG